MTMIWPPDDALLQTLFPRQRLQRGRVLLPSIQELAHDGTHSATARVGDFELVVQGTHDATGKPHYSALCSCPTQRFCEHAAAVFLKLLAEAREPLLQQWVAALRRKAGRDELNQLPKLPPADAAKLMDLLMSAEEPAARPAPAAPQRDSGEPDRFRPRLTLRTLGRGDGLLGMAPDGPLGPRGDQVTVAQVDWTYLREADGFSWQTPAPRSLLGSRPGPAPVRRDLAAEADARDQLWSLDLLPMDADRLQWRGAPADELTHLWTLVQEEHFGAFWAERVPELERQGWLVITLPGFTHRPVAGENFSIRIERLAGDRRLGSWLLSLGVEIDGEMLDLAPMVADLLRRDGRWLKAELIEEIEDESIIQLHAPGGRRIEAPAVQLKAIVGAMVDLLSDPKRAEGPIKLSDWDAARLLQIDEDRARWRFHGDADLRRMAERLRRAGTPPPVEPPAGLGLTLRPYQLAGLAWLQYLREQGLAGILADDMGLGKTAQALAHVLLEVQSGRTTGRPSLAVLPTSLLFNWAAEAKRIAPNLRVLVHQGPNRAEHFGAFANYDLVLTSYPLLWRDLTPLAAQRWHLLVLDEAQTVKNAAGRAAKGVRKLEARNRLCLTGTPLENHLGELWAQFDFLMPGFLGDSRSFQRLWRKPIEVNGESLRAQLLRARVRPFILRRRKDEVAAELPPLSTVIRRVELLGRQRELYESVRVACDKQVRKVLAQNGFAGALITVLDALLKLRQVCCDPWLIRDREPEPEMERAKLELLSEMLPELVDEGRRVLVFSQFTGMLDLIASRLGDLPHLRLTGDTPVAERGEVVRRFQAGEVPLMLVSLKAGGVGLNLTAADAVVHVDPWWNPAVEAQASARAHRIGQDKPVFVYKLVAAGSIEERMLELQARKAALAEGILGEDPAAGMKFAAEDLEMLLAPLA